MNFEKILILDDDLPSRRVLEVYLHSRNFAVSTAGTLAEADHLMRQEHYDLLLVDLALPDGDGGAWLQQTVAADPRPVAALVISGNGSVESITRCLQAGAFDYLTKPYTLEALAAAMQRAAAWRRASMACRHAEESGLSGEAATTRPLRLLAERAAELDTPALLCGEPGSGRRRVAGMIHRASGRCRGPLVTAHCGRGGEARLDNEIFGRLGRLELAEGGTLVLEEISELPHCLQIKLLGALREGAWVRPDGECRAGLDVRVIATTQQENFLPELRAAFGGSVLHVPPLRERIADVPLLAADWMERHGGSAGISQEAVRHLMAYAWPGNLRELENVLERASLLAHGGRLEAEAFDGLCPRTLESPRPPEPLLTLEEMEKRQVIRALEVTNQNRTRAAHLLKISVRTLRNKLHQYRAEDPTLIMTLARRRITPVAKSTGGFPPGR